MLKHTIITLNIGIFAFAKKNRQMKLRILGNTLRLRLKKSEIDEFAKEGKIENIVDFGETSFKYTLKASTRKSISALFVENEIVVKIPLEVAKNWVETDLVTLENKISTPKIIIEKDFKCTSKDCKETDEQKKDSFDKPKK